MSAIGVGDFVECVDATDCRYLSAGSVYLVERVWIAVRSYYNPDILSDAIELVNVPRQDGCVYSTWRFRPIYRPKADFLESLLTPADAPSEREGVEA